MKEEKETIDSNQYEPNIYENKKEAPNTHLVEYWDYVKMRSLRNELKEKVGWYENNYNDILNIIINRFTNADKERMIKILKKQIEGND